MNFFTGKVQENTGKFCSILQKNVKIAKTYIDNFSKKITKCKNTKSKMLLIAKQIKPFIVGLPWLKYT